MAVVGTWSPTVFHHPFFRLAVGIQVYCHQCHGVGRTAGECLDALFLVHTESRAHQRTVVIIVDIEHSAVAVEEFAYITGEIHHGAVLDGGDCHLFDIFYRKVDICPVLAVIGMAVKIDLI